MALGKNVKKSTKEDTTKQPTVESGKKTDPIPDEKEPKTVKPEPKASTPVVPASTPSLSQLNHELAGQQIEEDSRMLVVFPVGTEEYAFDIAQIKEVVPVPPISPVPQAKSHIRGVANVRGNVLAIIDLAQKFGLKKTDEDYINYVIVINSEEVKVAVASNQVPETLLISESQIDGTVDVVRKSNNEQNFIKGIIKKDNRMIIFIDVLDMVSNEQSVNN